MQTIYEPKGRAKEYGELALNLYRGCSHGCVYCYVPAVLRITRNKFLNPEPRKNIIEELKKVAPRYAGREVFLCFSCDPYQEVDRYYCFTRKAIKILHKNNISVRILTKSGYLSTRDFDLLTQKDYYGATLTFVSNTMTKKYEIYASSPKERLEALRIAHSLGINTWVSLEPVIDPEQTLELIEISHEYVDEYKIGRWNYDKNAKEIDWRDFTLKAVALLEKYNKKYYMKKDLKA